jgi:hypothetical protein
MSRRLSCCIAIAVLLVTPALGKDKNKPLMPAYVLHARTVRVAVDRDAGEPLDEPYANATARENVEKALLEWGRFQLVMDGQESDLVIIVRTGNGKAVRPTVRGGPIDQRPGVGQSTDSSIRIGAQRGQPTPLSDPSMSPPNRGPQIGHEVGTAEDLFEVYRGDIEYPADSSPAWRYIGKEGLRPPKIAAVEEFRKAVAEAEKPQVQPKKP